MLENFDKKRQRIGDDVLSCREEATRTPDPHVPNVVRYQLRYFSNLFHKFSELLGISFSASHFRRKRVQRYDFFCRNANNCAKFV